jgi:hypothetical protein
MLKKNKTRTICMNCLRSIVTDFHEGYDPIGTRLVVMYNCDSETCDTENSNVEFYDTQMRELKQI